LERKGESRAGGQLPAGWPAARPDDGATGLPMATGRRARHRKLAAAVGEIDRAESLIDHEILLLAGHSQVSASFA